MGGGLNIIALVALAAHSVYAQGTQASLGAALSGYPELSSFNGLLNSYPGIIGNVLEGKQGKVTVLAPSNDALKNYMAQTNTTDLGRISVTALETLLRYHVLDAPLNSTNFSVPKGITVPTRLKAAEFNLRSPGTAITDLYGADATGQVLFISKDPIGNAKFRVRQSTGDSANLRAGLSQTTTLTGVDGVWDGGSLQIISAVLAPPVTCSTTIKSVGDKLSSLKSALDKAGLWSALDNHPNVTCLAPNSAAFNAAGNPENTLGKDELTGALLFHTLPSVEYTNFLQNGAQIVSLANLTVRVTMVGDDIYFNDAKVISPNVLTNNGLIHVLDRVMSPNATGPSSSPSSTNPGSTGPTSSTSPTPTNKPNAASFASVSILAWAAVLAAGGIALM